MVRLDLREGVEVQKRLGNLREGLAMYIEFSMHHALTGIQESSGASNVYHTFQS